MWLIYFHVFCEMLNVFFGDKGQIVGLMQSFGVLYRH